MPAKIARNVVEDDCGEIFVHQTIETIEFVLGRDFLFINNILRRHRAHSLLPALVGAIPRA